MSTARSASPRIWKSTSAERPSAEIWPAFSASSGERMFVTACCSDERVDDGADRRVERRVARLQRVALDQDALAGGLLEPLVENRARPARLAGAGGVGRLLRPDQERSDRERDEDERQPAEDGDLAVVRAPAAHAGGEVP